MWWDEDCWGSCCGYPLRSWVIMAAVGWLSMEFGGGAQRLWIWNTAFLGGVTDNCLALAREKEEGTCLGGGHGGRWGWGKKGKGNSVLNMLDWEALSWC